MLIFHEAVPLWLQSGLHQCIFLEIHSAFPNIQQTSSEAELLPFREVNLGYIFRRVPKVKGQSVSRHYEYWRSGRFIDSHNFTVVQVTYLTELPSSVKFVLVFLLYLLCMDL
jgi:hypothetical protein